MVIENLLVAAAILAGPGRTREPGPAETRPASPQGRHADRSLETCAEPPGAELLAAGRRFT